MITKNKNSRLASLVKVNAAICVFSILSLFVLLRLQSGDISGRPMMMLLYCLAGFFAFTFYYYYQFITGRRSESSNPFPERIFLLTIFGLTLFIVFVMSQLVGRY